MKRCTYIVAFLLAIINVSALIELAYRNINLIGLIAFAGSVGLLCRRVWGWWICVVYLIIGVIACLSNPFTHFFFVKSPWHKPWVTESLVSIVFVTFLILLLVDLPLKWQRRTSENSSQIEDINI